MVEELAIQIDWQTITRSVLVLVLAYIAARVASSGLNRFSDRSVTHRMRIRMVIPLLKMGIYGFALYFVLVPVLDFSSSQLFAISGLVGAGIGFGLKDLIANMIGGLVIVLEQPYRVGDKITIGDDYGEVTDIGLRATKIRTDDDSMVSVPNYHAFSDAVSNATAGNPEMLVAMEFVVDPEADLETVERIIEEGIVASKYVYLSDNNSYSVTMEPDDQAITCTARAYVNDHRNELAFRSDVTERVETAFQEYDIPQPRYRRVTGE